MRQFIFRSLAVTGSAWALCLSGAVLARAQPVTGPAAGEGSGGVAQSAPIADAAPATASSFNDSTLEKFANAYVAVQGIQNQAAGSTSSTPEPVSSDLQTKMKAAVEQSGLQVEEFNQIAQQMVTDLDLRSRVAEKVQARSGN